MFWNPGSASHGFRVAQSLLWEMKSMGPWVREEDPRRVRETGRQLSALAGWCMISQVKKEAKESVPQGDGD